MLMNTNNFLTGDGHKYKDRRRIDIFLLSKSHLNTVNGTKVKNPKNKLLYKKAANIKKQTQYANSSKDCNCKKISQNINNKNAKYLIMGNVLRTENIIQGKNSLGLNKFDNNRSVKHQIIYLTYILPWKRAMQIARFLEDENVEANKICKYYRLNSRMVY